MPPFNPISVPTLYSSLLTASRSLARDPIRPSLQLPLTFENLVQRAFKRPQPIASSSSVDAEQHQVKKIEPLMQEEVERLGFGIGDLTRMERSLKGMQEIGMDVAAKKYPLSSRTLTPPTDPLYYTRLVQGVERAGRGESRSWWKTFFQSKGQA